MNDIFRDAFNSANAIVNDCMKKINALKDLKQVYQKLGEESISELNVLFDEMEGIEYEFPLPTMIYLAKSYHNIAEIDEDIERYTNVGNQWVKIRDKF